MTENERFCRSILPEVSRTFALTIPVLPPPLDLVVTVAYLLCRIADTLEDEAAEGPGPRGADLLPELAALVALPPDWRERARRFTADGVAALRSQAPPSESRLLASTEAVLDTYAVLPLSIRPHVERCLRTMTEGMAQVRRETGTSLEGLPNLEALRAYCYFVAGTVGEMLTGLFVDFSPEAAAHARALEARAAAFGRALQLTNILRDVREDLDRGSCWLPRTFLRAHHLSPQELTNPEHRAEAVAMLDELIEIARGETATALEYSLALPVDPPGLRLFCLWPLFFSVLTLARLKGNPEVFEPAPVKISRDEVARVMAATSERLASNDALRALYQECEAGPDTLREGAVP